MHVAGDHIPRVLYKIETFKNGLSGTHQKVQQGVLRTDGSFICCLCTFTRSANFVPCLADEIFSASIAGHAINEIGITIRVNIENNPVVTNMHFLP